MNQSILYTENELTQKKINVLNIDQRTLKRFFLSKPNVTDGRIFFKNKLFVPDVGQLKFRFIKKFHDDPRRQTQNPFTGLPGPVPGPRGSNDLIAKRAFLGTPYKVPGLANMTMGAHIFSRIAHGSNNIKVPIGRPNYDLY